MGNRAGSNPVIRTKISSKKALKFAATNFIYCLLNIFQKLADFEIINFVVLILVLHMFVSMKEYDKHFH